MSPNDAISRPPRRIEGAVGFTLLEVLAAVMILAIWFTVIFGTAVQGLRAEGVSRRRLEAAMIADRALAELEASTLDGSVPPIDSDISEEDIYTVTVTVRPFSEGGAAAAAQAVSGANSEDAAPPDLEALLGQQMPERTGNLRAFDIVVAWQEGSIERSVTRTSFAFDLEGALQAYEAAGISIDAATPPSNDDPSGAQPATAEGA